jgi:hypothetical protein
MTITEIKEEFLVRYNGRASNNAPSLDDYEISVFLTHALLSMVKEFYGVENRQQKSFEGNEKRRRNLATLVQTDILLPTADFYTDPQIQIGSSSSILVKLPEDLWYLLQEQVLLTSQEACYNNKYALVKPTTHDEYMVQKDNPFKKPHGKLVWRLDLRGRIIKYGKRIVELVHSSNVTISKYQIRYLKLPLPIILSDLGTIDPTLSILGYTVPQEIELPDDFLLEIIMRAVTVALVQQASELSSSVQMNAIT